MSGMEGHLILCAPVLFFPSTPLCKLWVHSPPTPVSGTKDLEGGYMSVQPPSSQHHHSSLTPPGGSHRWRNYGLHQHRCK